MGESTLNLLPESHKTKILVQTPPIALRASCLSLSQISILKLRIENRTIGKNSTPNHPLRLKIGSNLHFMALHTSYDQIFVFLIFCSFRARFVAKKSKFWQISALESRKNAKNQKIKNLILGIVEGHEMKV